MFNGIIKNTGIISKIIKNNKDCDIFISSKLKFKKKDLGSSISCSGACLTLKQYNRNSSTYFLSKETLDRTNFRTAVKGDIINLEKSLKYGTRMSGHFVQGHVDVVALVKKIDFRGKSWFIHFKLSKKFKKFMVKKGSIAVNGVSLTISKIFNDGFEIVVIPQTLKLTNLIKLKAGDLVNIEFDVLGKYIRNFLK